MCLLSSLLAWPRRWHSWLPTEGMQDQSQQYQKLIPVQAVCARARCGAREWLGGVSDTGGVVAARQKDTEVCIYCSLGISKKGHTGAAAARQCWLSCFGGWDHGKHLEEGCGRCTLCRWLASFSRGRGRWWGTHRCTLQSWTGKPCCGGRVDAGQGEAELALGCGGKS